MSRPQLFIVAEDEIKKKYNELHDLRFNMIRTLKNRRKKLFIFFKLIHYTFHKIVIYYPKPRKTRYCDRCRR